MLSKNLEISTSMTFFYKFWKKARVYYTLSISRGGGGPWIRHCMSNYVACMPCNKDLGSLTTIMPHKYLLPRWWGRGGGVCRRSNLNLCLAQGRLHLGVTKCNCLHPKIIALCKYHESSGKWIHADIVFAHPKLLHAKFTH